MIAKYVHVMDSGIIENVSLTRRATDEGAVFWTMDPEEFDRKYRSPTSYNVFVKKRLTDGSGFYYTNSPWAVVQKMEGRR